MLWLACAALAPLFIFVGTGLAEDGALKVGDRLEPFTLEDQHGENHQLGSQVRAVLFSRDRDGGEVMSDAMEGHDGEFLAARGIVYVNDISAMPGMVTRLFALPKMRRRPYPILLDRDGDLTARFPDRSQAATLIRLDHSTLTSVDSITEAAELKVLLEAISPESGVIGQSE